MRKFLKNKNSGFTVVEILFYIVIFVALSVVVINSLLVMTKSFKETTILTSLTSNGNIMESITREVKQANSIHTITANTLKLNTTDSGGAPRTVTFSLSGTNVQFSENDVVIGNLNSATVAVNSLSFTQITTAESRAVKISMTIRSTNDALSRTYEFYDTAVLRGLY